MNNLFLYPEDFASHKDWIQICDSLKVSYESQSIEIIYEKVYAEELNESKIIDYAN